MKRRQIILIAVAVGGGALLLLVFQIVMRAMLARWLQMYHPTQNPIERRFETARIRADDLPFGWRLGGIRKEDVNGTLAAEFIWYYGTWDSRQTWVNVSQELLLCPDTKSAASAYEQVVVEEFTPDWFTPSELMWEGHADRMKVACFSGYINGIRHYPCSAVGLYGDMISILRGNVFDDRWLTMADFRAVLEAMDRRVVAAQEMER